MLLYFIKIMKWLLLPKDDRVDAVPKVLWVTVDADVILLMSWRFDKG
jgi:hypothetical protein